jgi:hypothetical protein
VAFPVALRKMQLAKDHQFIISCILAGQVHTAKPQTLKAYLVEDGDVE